jgi:hypothetical protein
MSTIRAIAVALALSTGVSATACIGGAEVRATAVAPAPRLVWVAPGIWVIEDHDRPVFYDGTYYWMYSDGWYRSDLYYDGFVRVSVVPPIVLGIHRPHAYVRYRAPRGARVRVIDHRHHRPAARTRRR